MAVLKKYPDFAEWNKTDDGKDLDDPNDAKGSRESVHFERGLILKMTEIKQTLDFQPRPKIRLSEIDPAPWTCRRPRSSAQRRRAPDGAGESQIGRASCRERVWR